MKRKPGSRYVITVDTDNAVLCANLFFHAGLRFRASENGTFAFSSHRDGERAKALIAKRKISYSVSARRGFSDLLSRYRHRYGVWLGILILFAGLRLSSDYIWEINVVGNRNVPTEEILSGLDSLGCGIGDRISKIDFAALQNRFLEESENVAWIAVNMDGNVANVEIREMMPGTTEKERPANIVAGYDAQILSVEAYNGNAVVKPGDTVRAGDLLISGVIDSASVGLRYETAEGVVRAYVSETVDVFVPFETTEKIATGNVVRRYALNIFGKTIKFSKNSRNPYTLCDIIEIKKDVLFFGKVSVPVTVVTDRYCEYENSVRYRSVDETVAEAFRQLQAKTDLILADAELIERSARTEERDGGIAVIATVSSIKDIAVSVPFDVKGRE